MIMPLRAAAPDEVENVGRLQRITRVVNKVRTGVVGYPPPYVCRQRSNCDRPFYDLILASSKKAGKRAAAPESESDGGEGSLIATTGVQGSSM